MCGLTYELSPAHIRIHQRSRPRLPRPARRAGLAPAGAGGVRRRAECARGLGVQRRRSGALARSAGAAGFARGAAQCARAIEIGRHSAFLRRVRGAQGAITKSQEIAHASRQDRHRHRLHQRHRARHRRGLRPLGRQRRAQRLRRRHADREDAIGAGAAHQRQDRLFAGRHEQAQGDRPDDPPDRRDLRHGRHHGEQRRHPACRADRGIPRGEVGRHHGDQSVLGLPRHQAGAADDARARAGAASSTSPRRMRWSPRPTRRPMSRPSMACSA